MSNYQPKDLTGSLFKNTDKASDKHPDYRGDCLVDGVAYYMDAWINEASSGRKYMAVKFKAKDAARPAPAPTPAPAPRQQAKPQQRTGTGFDHMQDDYPDIPFASSALSCDVIGNARKVNRSRSAR